MDRSFDTGDLAIGAAPNDVTAADGAARQTIRIEPPQRVMHISMGPQAAIDADLVWRQVLAGSRLAIAVEVIMQPAFRILPLLGNAQSQGYAPPTRSLSSARAMRVQPQTSSSARP